MEESISMFPSVLIIMLRRQCVPSALGWRKEAGLSGQSHSAAKPDTAHPMGLPKDLHPPWLTMLHGLCRMPPCPASKVSRCAHSSPSLYSMVTGLVLVGSLSPAVLLSSWDCLFCFISDPRFFLRPFLWVCTFVWIFISKHSKNIYYMLCCSLAVMMVCAVSHTEECKMSSFEHDFEGPRVVLSSKPGSLLMTPSLALGIDLPRGNGLVSWKPGIILFSPFYCHYCTKATPLGLIKEKPTRQCPKQTCNLTISVGSCLLLTFLKPQNLGIWKDLSDHFVYNFLNAKFSSLLSHEPAHLNAFS